MGQGAVSMEGVLWERRQARTWWRFLGSMVVLGLFLVLVASCLRQPAPAVDQVKAQRAVWMDATVQLGRAWEAAEAAGRDPETCPRVRVWARRVMVSRDRAFLAQRRAGI